MKTNRLSRLKKRYEDDDAEMALGNLVRDDIRNLESSFDYDSLEIGIEDKNSLMEYEKNLMLQGKRIGEIACIIGETLENARAIFKRYATEEEPLNFANWYRAMGFNKDQVYLFRGRFKLALEKPEYKENILKLSDATIKEAINKKTPETIVKKVLEGELKTAKEVKEERKKNLEFTKSRALDFEINTDSKVQEIAAKILNIAGKLKNIPAYKLNKISDLLKEIEEITEGLSQR